MPAKVVETHVLAGDPDAKVAVWDNGDVDVYVGGVIVPVARLGEIVAFVEAHGQVTVKAND